MRNFWVLLFLLIISFNFLNAMQLILHNDRVITGKFIKADKENVIIFSQEKLVTVSLHTIVAIFDDKLKEISKLDLINLKKGHLNYNSVKEEIKITPSNVDESSKFFPICTNYATLHLKDNSKYKGYISGNDGKAILMYDEKEDTHYLIVHKDIKMIIQNSIEVTEEILASTDGIDFSGIESFEIINKQKYSEKKIEEYNKYKKPKKHSLILGCDFGTNHNIFVGKKEYRYNLEPSGYVKLETLSNTYQSGYGYGLQFHKVIKNTGGINCTFLPIYFVLAKRSKFIGIKSNIGINLFFADSSYSGEGNATLPGFYAALGPLVAISDRFDIEIMYTINNGNIRTNNIINQSISFGFIIYHNAYK